MSMGLDRDSREAPCDLIRWGGRQWLPKCTEKVKQGRYFGVEPERKVRGADYVRNMDADKVTRRLREFVAERDWNKFHSQENLAKSISIEAAELLECFQWNSEADVDQVRDELADVLTYCLLLSDKYGLDPVEIILEKLEKTREKYPIEKARGKSEKYDRL